MMSNIIIKGYLVAFIVLLCAATPVCASWITFVNCANLSKGLFTPQYQFGIYEPVCFYGGGYPNGTTRIYLENNLTKKIRYIDVVTHEGTVSSLDGYFFTDLEEGNFRLPGACPEQYVCSNQEGDNYCKPTDTSCQLVRFIADGSNCIIDTSFKDPDTDHDNWTNACDPLPDDPLEWFDADIDGVGSNNDMNDFNSEIVTLINPDRKPGNNTQNNTVPQNNTNPSGPGNTSSNTTKHGGGGGGGTGGGGGNTGGYNPVFPNKACTPEYECDFWGDCIDGKQHRNCILKNNCTNVGNLPQEVQDCAMPVETPTPQSTAIPGVATGVITNLTEPAALPSTAGTNLITGQLIKAIGGHYSSLGVAILVLALLIAGGIFAWLKIRKPR